jgi:hypothetical protein
MQKLLDLYKILPVCCPGMKKQDKLLKKYNKLFSYILEQDNPINIDNYSVDQLYNKYIEFIDNHTICKNSIEKLYNVDNWLKIYPTTILITQAFSKLDIGYSGGEIDNKIYIKKLIDMLIKYRVVLLTMLGTYANKHNGDSFYENLDEISLRACISEKTIYNEKIKNDIDIIIYYDKSRNVFVRKDTISWTENTYEKIVPEYTNINLIDNSIIPFVNS